MKPSEIAVLIEQHNERAQADMARDAHRLIERIATLQQAKSNADKEIAECREQLRQLSITPITSAELLGESL